MARSLSERLNRESNTDTDVVTGFDHQMKNSDCHNMNIKELNQLTSEAIRALPGLAKEYFS